MNTTAYLSNDGEYTYFGERYSFKVVDLDLSEEGNE